MAETDMLFQLELTIEPESLPSDFLGGTWIISMYCLTAAYQCCAGRVSDTNCQGVYPDETIIGEIMLPVDTNFMSGDCVKLRFIAEAGVNQAGGTDSNCDDLVMLEDVLTLVDFLFITDRGDRDFNGLLVGRLRMAIKVPKSQTVTSNYMCFGDCYASSRRRR